MSFRGGTRSAIAVAVLIVVSCVSLTTACTRDETEVEPAPSPTSTPPFATDEEALEAARATYEGFMEASESILSLDESDASKIDEYVTLEMAQREKASYAEYVADGRTLTGRSVIISAELQKYDSQPQIGGSTVFAYVCVDFSAVDVLDRDGVSIVAGSRPAHVPFEVIFLWDPPAPNDLRISSNAVWAGDGVCES
jgi:hypothetical protein